MAISDKIKHVVVLMLENRSFDNILGHLHHINPEIDGITGQESNPSKDNPLPIVIRQGVNFDYESMSVPTPDPGELWTDINQQIFGLENPAPSDRPLMNGFVNNYAQANGKPEDIMYYYSAEQVPVLSQLAQAYGVCDRWFASAPCQTWPNRFFLHTGTANGYENNSPAHFPYLMDTIFNRLSEHDQEWGIFYHDFPQTLTLSKLWPHLNRFHFYHEFKEFAEQGQLPAYSFIEPRFFAELENLPNDQHPPHHVGLGEDLIADVYNAVRLSPNWPNTLLIIIYDEHGGCYDHVAPPAALSPDRNNHQPFNFDRYGVRIPAVLISPYIKPGTVLRPNDSTATHIAYPYDHTSVIATLRKCFNLGKPLSNRDAVAPDLEKVLNLDTPDNNALGTVSPKPYTIPPNKLAEALAAPLNDFQKEIQHAAGHLPNVGNAEKTIEAQIVDHIEYLKQELGKDGGTLKDITEHTNPKEALPYIVGKLQGFLEKGKLSGS